MTYHHGIKLTEINTGVRTIPVISTAVIGLIVTSSDADAEAFPLNRPVLVTDIRSAIAKAGTQGTMLKALNAIADQADPVLVIVRVDPGISDTTANAAVIGTTGSGGATGLQALLAAKAQLQISPRIIGCPGLDTQPVVAAMVIVAKKLRAMSYAYCHGATTVAEALTYRAQFAARELMLVWPDFTAFDAVALETAPAYVIARALGLRAQVDEQQGWHKTISNVAVDGVTGLTADIHWDLQQTGTDADTLNGAGITTLVHAGGGYRFWGSRTCSAEPLFAFESATRTAQILADTIAEGLLWAVDKPLHPSLARDIIESINARFRALKAQGYIVDGKAWIDPALNETADLKNGQLTIDYDFTPVPPLESLQLNQRITDRYLANFAALV